MTPRTFARRMSKWTAVVFGTLVGVFGLAYVTSRLPVWAGLVVVSLVFGVLLGVAEGD